MRNDREKHGLRGSVKSVIVDTAQFEEQNGQIKEKPWFSHTSAFNQDGWLIEQVNRSPDGSEWRASTDYSDSGKLLTTRSFDASGARVKEVRYIYGNDGRLVAEQHTTQDGNVGTPTTYACESGGGKIKIQELDFSGEANLMIGIEETNTAISAGEAKLIETHYDDQGEAVEVKILNTDGALVSRVEIVRDARGCPLEETQYVGDVVPFGTDATGSCSTEETTTLTEEQKVDLASEIARLFSPGTAMSRHTHTYDEEGRLIESKLTMMGMDAGRQSFVYDEAGNKTEEASYNGDGTLGTKAIFTRDYDEHGNWTRELVSTASSGEVEFGLFTPVHATRRTITYYD